ncbi:MAG: metallophosphoesterase family protein [Bacteroidota bacterium]
MKTQELGRKSGEMLIFGGVYSNLQALEKLHAIATESNILPENIICTGDIVGYCAQPDESLRFIREWGVHSITGNVELQIRNGDESCGCNFDEGTRCDMFSRNWYPFAYQAVSDEMKTWLQDMPEFIRFEYAGKKGVVLHGGLTDVSQFIFKSTEWSIKQQILTETNADFILAGHCGLPFADTLENKHWLNAGVIGMPANDATDRVWYMKLNDENGFEYSHHAFAYDHQEAARLMNEQSLPMSYAKTLSTGIWDNCEILPDEETALQGARIEF